MILDNQINFSLWFDDDLDETGQLVVEAKANGFSGKGAAYFNKSQIKDFAKALTAYPLEKEHLPEIRGGIGIQENLVIKVYPINGRGDLAIQIRLMTELWNNERVESQHSVQLEIQTHYQPLTELSKEIEDLLDGKIKEAKLKNY